MNGTWKYVVLFIVAILITVAAVYFLAASKFHVPVTSFLPNGNTASLAPTPGPIPTSIQKMTFQNGRAQYIVRGKFISDPFYNSVNVLQGSFVIDQDPQNHTIPVIMTLKTGKINVGRAQGSFQGTIVWKLEDTESLRQSIKVNTPVELRLFPISPELTAYDMSVQQTMNNILSGNWNIPHDFVLHPPMVAVVQ